MPTIKLSNLKTLFGIDLRTLALFRMSLATMIIVDLIFRARDLGAFFTDSGVLTRAASMANANAWRVSLHWMNGAEWFQALLFIIAGLIACCLLLGYRTRLVSFLSWFMLLSLQNRNEFLTSGGDNLLLVMSFWAMLLPIGARFSIDAALDKKYQQDSNASLTANNHYFSIISIAVLLQVMYLYFFTAILKTGDVWQVTMDAAWYAVNLDHIATPFGYWLRDYPLFLSFGTCFVWYLELLAFVFIFSPVFHVPVRLLTLALLLLMHATFFLTLNIALFPFIDLVSLTVFFPGACWDWLAKQFRSESRTGIRIYYDEGCGFCKKTCLLLRMFLLPSSVPITPAQSDPAIYAVMEKHNSWVVVDHTGQQHLHWQGVQYLFRLSVLFKPVGMLMALPPLMTLGNKIYAWVANNRNVMGQFTEQCLPYRAVNHKPGWLLLALGGFCFYLVTYINIAGVYEWGIKKPQHIYTAEKILRLDQRWSMFAPYPPTYSEMMVIPGKTRAGQDVDVQSMAMESANWEWPELLSAHHENYRWRKYIGRIRSSKSDTIRRGFGSYLCNRWNNRDIPVHKQLASFEIYFVRRKTVANEQPKPESKIRTWRHWCFAEYSPGKPMAFLSADS